MLPVVVSAIGFKLIFAKNDFNKASKGENGYNGGIINTHLNNGWVICEGLEKDAAEE